MINQKLEQTVNDDRYSHLVNVGQYGESATLWTVVEYDLDKGYRKSTISSAHEAFLIEDKYKLSEKKILPETQ